MTQISERLLVQAHLAAKQLKPLTADEEAFYRREIAAELQKQNAVLVAHYYCDPVIQALAEETGGCVTSCLFIYSPLGFPGATLSGCVSALSKKCCVEAR